MKSLSPDLLSSRWIQASHSQASQANDQGLDHQRTLRLVTVVRVTVDIGRVMFVRVTVGRDSGVLVIVMGAGVLMTVVVW